MAKITAIFEFYEKNLNGNFEVEPCTYSLTGETKEEIVNRKDILWQAIEIDGFDNSEVLVIVNFEEDGEYLDRDEFIMITNIVRTDKPSRFVEWGNAAPCIFEIDRNSSSINIETN